MDLIRVISLIREVSDKSYMENFACSILLP